VDSETGRLNPPKPLRDILSSVDLKTHYVELVGEQPDPTVKIISKKDTFDKFKERKAKMKSTAKNEIEQKEIQLTWGVASGYLAHKLKKVRQELEKGNRVNVLYARKRGQRLPSPQEMEARVQETLDLMRDVGEEWKQRDVQRAVTVIHLQGGPNQVNLPTCTIIDSVVMYSAPDLTD
jgi:translation initiation factor IF-3